jgi:DNA-3-methyladenine glycosylase
VEAPALSTLVALSTSFFDRHPAEVAPDLLGCFVVSTSDDVTTGGMIVETEAYLGSDDPGSHAATKGVTKRNATMYGPPGTAYVYFTYGNHHMFNIVCQPDGTAGAVLIRALEPIWGQDQMTARRHGRPLHELCDGPGKLAAALGIDLSDNGVVLGRGRLSVYDGQRPVGPRVLTSGRVGLSAGHELELRYYLEGNSHVSRGRTGPPTSHRGSTRRR